VRVRELRNVVFHDVPPGSFQIDSVEITADLVCHPGSTLGYRLEESDSVLTYMPDHEPALASAGFLGEAEWMSGYQLAAGASALIHDAQYTDEEYQARIGWGHTSFSQLADYVEMTGAERLVTFHHDPSHTDETLDELHEELRADAKGLDLIPGTAGRVIEL
jgi:ribonuclease BN (tRNA processing enzyme)